MGFRQNCSAGSLRVSSAGCRGILLYENRQNIRFRTELAKVLNGEAQMSGYSLSGTGRTGKGTLRTKDSSLGYSAQNCAISSFRRKNRSALDHLQPQQTISCYLLYWVAHNNFVNLETSRLSWSQRVHPALTVRTHSSSRNISSPSPGSPRFDSEEDAEFQEEGKNGNVPFRNFDSDNNSRRRSGDEWQIVEDRLEQSESPGNSDESYTGYDPSAGSQTGVSNLFYDGNEIYRENGDRGWLGESRPEKNVSASGSREDGADSAESESYDSWDEESDTSSQSGSSVSSGSTLGSAADSLAIGGKEPVYQVLEVHPRGNVEQREVSRRQLLRSTAGLRLRDIRSVDPSLWVTNSVPAILVRDQAILLNLGSLRAIATAQSVLIFEHDSIGAQAFMNALLPRLRTASNGHSPIMPFELEVVEAALISRTQRLERMLMEVEPRVVSLLKVLPNRYTADVLEELRLGKQALVDLAAKAGALRQMLLELLDHPEDIRKMTIMGRTCNINKEDGSVKCLLPVDKQSAEDEEEEIEMLLEYYLQRCDSCHGQAEKLLDSAKEMEDSIGVNLSSRRLEVSRLELLLQVGTFCSALGALVAGIFGMNLKSYLEEHVMAFYFTTAGIVFGGIALFIAMFSYLKIRRIL